MFSSKFWKWIILTIIPIILVFLFSLLLGKEIAEEIKEPLVKQYEYKVNLGTPSIEQIFSEDKKWLATLSAENIKTIIFTGDIIPARSVNSKVLKNNDFNWPYLKTKDLTKNADLTVASLETSLIKDCLVTDTGMIFCGDIRNIQGLVFAGIDLVNVANNHFANQEQEGIRETINGLRENKIDAFGLGEIFIKEVKGTKFSFLAYNDIEKEQIGIANVNEEKIKDDIKKAKEISDFVVVAFHWGTEYQDMPDIRQIELAHFAIDNNADLVIGNHPHWIQPVEIYKDKIIVYAHGNFVFDQMWSLKTRQGIIGKYIFYDDKLIDIEFTPIQIEDYGQPFVLEKEERSKVLNSLKENSLNLNN